MFCYMFDMMFFGLLFYEIVEWYCGDLCVVVELECKLCVGGFVYWGNILMFFVVDCGGLLFFDDLYWFV